MSVEPHIIPEKEMESLLRALNKINPLKTALPVFLAGLLWMGMAGSAFAMDKGISDANAPAVNAAYEAIRTGNYEKAESLVGKAMKTQPDNYDLTMLMADILSRKKDWKRQTEILSKVIEAYPEDGYALASRGFAYLNRKLGDAALADFQKALKQKLSPDVKANIRATIESLTKAKENMLVQKTFQDAETLWKENKRQKAYEKYRRIKDMPSASDYIKSESLWKMAEYHNERKEKFRAMRYGGQSADLLPDSSVRNLQMAYLSIANKEDRAAALYFERAIETHKLDKEETRIKMETFYAYKRIKENEKVLDYLKRVIDDYADRMKKAPTPVQSDVDTAWGLRREYSDMTRKFGSNTGLFYVGKRNGDDILQGIQEFYWQPYYANGQRIQIYGQLGETLYASPGIDGNDTLYGNLGLRVEPLSEYNLVLSVERLFKIGDQTENDTRVKAAYSWDTGLELETYVRNWAYATFFTEYVYAMENKYSLNVGEVRLGRSFRFDKISDRISVSPHAFANWNYNDRFARGSDRWNLFAGPGIHIRTWYREDKYSASRSYLDITVQYRFGLTGESDDAFLLTLSNSF